jgi:hypothetical protein
MYHPTSRKAPEENKSSPSPDTTEDETEAADGEAHTYPSDQEKLQQTNALI